MNEPSLPTGVVRRATCADHAFLLHLQKKHSNAVGFIPAAAMRWYEEHQLVHLVEENGEPAGYVLGRGSMRFNRRIRPITQAAICFDAQRRHLGLQLVELLGDLAREQLQTMLQCWCANDLDAMNFWPAAGFTAIATREPTNRRGRSLTLWRKSLTVDHPPGFFELPPVAGWRAARIRSLELPRCHAPSNES